MGLNRRPQLVGFPCKKDRDKVPPFQKPPYSCSWGHLHPHFGIFPLYEQSSIRLIRFIMGGGLLSFLGEHPNPHRFRFLMRQREVAWSVIREMPQSRNRCCEDPNSRSLRGFLRTTQSPRTIQEQERALFWDLGFYVLHPPKRSRLVGKRGNEVPYLIPQRADRDLR